MEPVIGIFKACAEAERAIMHLNSAGIPNERINLLMPGASENEIDAVPTMETEQPGVGKAIGSVVGGALGAAGGMSLGAAAASVLVPGVGPVIAVGLLGAALLGVGGAVGGAIAGQALDESMSEGLPIDEMFVYEDALRQGRSVVIVLSDESEQAEVARKVMKEAGAESIDSARESWWLGVRDAEAEHYTVQGRDFTSVESDYRRGFEAALLPRTRGRSYYEVVKYLVTRYPRVHSESFRRGYDRGMMYSQDRITKRKASA